MTGTTGYRVREQMPGWLGWLDDEYGIGWRVKNAVRRISVRRGAAFTRAWLRPPVYRQPVLIVGLPRSGTTLVFQLLRASGRFVSRQTEGHDVWRRYHHPRRSGWRSDWVGPGEVAANERRFVAAHFYANAGAGRLLEKTADNVVRVPYLLDLFPDAHLVLIKRDPCNVLNSYVNMWRHPQGRFRSYFLPTDLRIPGYPHRRRWCSTLVDGWRDLTTAAIPEIAFRQWSEYVRAVVAAREIVPAGQWTEIYFEDLLDRPGGTAAALCERIGIPMDAGMRAAVEALVARPVNPMSPTGQGDWKGQNLDAIRALLPRLSAGGADLGYRVDPETGEVTLVRHTPDGTV